MRRRIERGPLLSTLALLLLIPLLPLAARGAAHPQSKQKVEERKKPAKPELESKSPEEQPAQENKGYTIGVNVDLVVLHAAVHDKAGKFVSGLKKDTFKVLEDGVAQQVSMFAQEDVPVSLGLLLDTSGSMRNKIELVTKSALALIKASNPADQVFLVGFNDEVELLEDYTSDIDLISDALDNVLVTGGTALYDAIYLGVQKAQKGVRPKKAIVVISDGEDKDSYYKLDELLAKVQESDVAVYCIGYLNPTPDKGLFGRFSKSGPEKAREALAKISEETGGKSFFPQKLTEMGGIVTEIAHELRNQYSIGYISSNTAKDGSWRRVKITLESAEAAKYHVRSRTGYFAPKLP